MKNVILFATGSGSNVENIVNYFSDKENIQVSHVYTNNSKSGVIERCQRLEIPYTVFTKEEFINGTVRSIVESNKPDLIVLAGFLLLVPEEFVHAFSNKIINIHPSLLPKYGGKGMYGANVHKAVVENKEEETGITIHYVNEKFDEGEIILQSSFEVLDMNLEAIEAKIHELEFYWLPRIIEDLLAKS